MRQQQDNKMVSKTRTRIKRHLLTHLVEQDRAKSIDLLKSQSKFHRNLHNSQVSLTFTRLENSITIIKRSPMSTLLAILHRGRVSQKEETMRQVNRLWSANRLIKQERQLGRQLRRSVVEETWDQFALTTYNNSKFSSNLNLINLVRAWIRAKILEQTTKMLVEDQFTLSEAVKFTLWPQLYTKICLLILKRLNFPNMMKFGTWRRMTWSIKRQSLSVLSITALMMQKGTTNWRQVIKLRIDLRLLNRLAKVLLVQS